MDGYHERPHDGGCEFPKFVCRVVRAVRELQCELLSLLLSRVTTQPHLLTSYRTSFTTVDCAATPKIMYNYPGMYSFKSRHRARLMRAGAPGYNGPPPGYGGAPGMAPPGVGM